MAAKRGLAREGAECLGETGAQATLGKGVFEEVVGGGGAREISIAQEIQAGGDDGNLDLEEARLVGGDLFEASGGAADAGLGEIVDDELEDRRQAGHAVVARRIGNLVEDHDGYLHLALGAQLAGEAKGGGDGGGVGRPHDPVEAHGVKTQRGRVLRDVIPNFGLALKGGVGEISQGGVHIGASTGHGGVNERGIAVIELLQNELVDGGDGELGGRLARQEVEDGGEVLLSVTVVVVKQLGNTGVPLETPVAAEAVFDGAKPLAGLAGIAQVNHGAHHA